MNTLSRTATFDSWLKRLKDVRGKALVIGRLRAMERGHFGDFKPLGGGLLELRINHGPGYRVYLVRQSTTSFVLLCGGSKSDQSRDIERARRLVFRLRENNA